MSKLPKDVDGLRGIGLKSMFTGHGVRSDDYGRFAALDIDPDGAYARGMEGLHGQAVSYTGMKPS